MQTKTFAIVFRFVFLATTYSVSSFICNAQETKSEVLDGKVQGGPATPAVDEPQAPRPGSKPKPEESLAALAAIAKQLAGDWRVTAASGKSMFHSWRSGPGGLSLVRETFGQSADGKPWRELLVFYWHSQQEQIRVLGLSSFANGVSEGTFQFDGKTIRNENTLFQAGGRHRKMAQEWVTQGPGKLREILYEDSGRDGYKPLVEFDNVRISVLPERPTSELGVPGEDSKLPPPILSILNHKWTTIGVTNPDNYRNLSFEWIPYADLIHAKTIEFTTSGKMHPLNEMFLYRHTGTNQLRFLNIGLDGAFGRNVFEGNVKLSKEKRETPDKEDQDKSLNSENQAAEYELALVQNEDGSLREDVWSVRGNEREQMFSARFLKIHAPETTTR